VTAITSGSFSSSALRTRDVTITSLSRPFGNMGLRGLSVNLLVRISFVVGLPSRLKNPPGNLPAAYVFSLYSTESGKKSIPGRGGPYTTADITTVSPKRIVTAPLACLAIWPVSMTRFLPANSFSTF
jgi:hypothetical protein